MAGLVVLWVLLQCFYLCSTQSVVWCDACTCCISWEEVWDRSVIYMACVVVLWLTCSAWLTTVICKVSITAECHVCLADSATSWAACCLHSNSMGCNVALFQPLLGKLQQWHGRNCLRGDWALEQLQLPIDGIMHQADQLHKTICWYMVQFCLKCGVCP